MLINRTSLLWCLLHLLRFRLVLGRESDGFAIWVLPRLSTGYSLECSMSKAENGRTGLVFPSKDDSSSEELKQGLQDAGFCEADQAWLVQIFERPDCFGNSDSISSSVFKDDLEDSLPHILKNLEEQHQIGKDHQTRLAFLFSVMLGFGPVYLGEMIQPNIKLVKSDGGWDVPQWADEFRRHAKFRAERLDWNKLKSSVHKLDDLILFLFPNGMPLVQVVDFNLLDPIQRRGWSSNDFEDPKQLEFWLILRFRSDADYHGTIRLDMLLSEFSGFPEDVLGGKILGLLNSTGYALDMAGLDSLNDGWQAVACELIPFLELLEEKAPESNQKRSSLLKAWWWLSVVIYSRSMGGLECSLSDERRNRLLESAAKHMGFLRQILRDTPEDFKGKNSAGEVCNFYYKAFEVLCAFAPPWKRLKPLLLVFTQMKVQAVASDLRPWSELGREDPPKTYSKVALWIEIAMYPQNLQDELSRDPHLQELREEFAKFCLGRLKTRKNDINADREEFVEPRPIWRQCYVQALTVLRVNPGGRAHRTLFWISKNDPDEECRKLAKRAHRQIRHIDQRKPNLERGASPRRPLFEAFWWFRQAHLLTLGKEIDEAGAMRTRRKELHRTREKDDRLNWKA